MQTAPETIWIWRHGERMVTGSDGRNMYMMHWFGRLGRGIIWGILNLDWCGDANGQFLICFKSRGKLEDFEDSKVSEHVFGLETVKRSVLTMEIEQVSPGTVWFLILESDIDFALGELESDSVFWRIQKNQNCFSSMRILWKPEYLIEESRAEFIQFQGFFQNQNQNKLQNFSSFFWSFWSCLQTF